MGRYQSIENALKAINESVFQELCDKLLALRNPNYAAFVRTGSQSGKLKTIKGTPDSFFQLPDGQYIFIEATTNISDSNKLDNDIRSCFDEHKSKIPADKIKEIILCFNFNIDSNRIEELTLLARDFKNDVRLSFWSLDRLSIELSLQHRDLVHEYLNLPLDSGQIVSIETFISEYNKAAKGIATPLDNEFVHRQDEKISLTQSLFNTDFTILTGPAGVGKTKLAVETVTAFIKENRNYRAYCISYKNCSLMEDLYQYFDKESDYILFIDDANRIDSFTQIIGFYKSIRSGKLKILITVRDYAYNEIGVLCQEYNPNRIDLAKLSDEHIIDIIKSKPFKILNHNFQKEIVRIADGNPRLAIMTSLLAKEKQHLSALSDVSDLFDKYFSTFVRDHNEFENEFNLRCLGVISFFNTIRYEDKNSTTTILNDFEIEYSEFVDAINVLDNLEIVEIKFNHVKIPEQNLSTYFFYRAFVKDELLPFEILLENYFETQHYRLRDCVIPANNTFGHKKVMDKLKPHLQRYLKTLQNGSEIKVLNFLKTFWYYLQVDALDYVYRFVNELPSKTVSKYNVSYNQNEFAYNRNQIIELLGEFFTSPEYLRDVIELSFEYIRKSPESLPELLYTIRERLTFNPRDQGFNFHRQKVLFEILQGGLEEEDVLYSISFYELSKTFLSFRFHHTEAGRNLSISWYEFPIPSTQTIIEFRKSIWESIDNNFEKYPNESLDLLQHFISNRDPEKQILEYDLNYLEQLINMYLSVDSFIHCKYVQDLIRWCKRFSITHPSFVPFSDRFTNSIYEIFLKIDWDRWRNKESYEFRDYHEFEKLKEEEIRTSFVFNSTSEAKEFYKVFRFLKLIAENDWSYNRSLDLIIDQNCNSNFDLGLQILGYIIEDDNKIDFVPRLVLLNHLKSQKNSKIFWKIIQERDFKNKAQWELAFYDYLDDSLLDQKFTRAILNTLGKVDKQATLLLNRLHRFISVEPNLFKMMLKVVTDRNENEEAQIKIWDDLFTTYYEYLGDDINLIKKAYFQQDHYKSNFDFEGKGFINILKNDQKFLNEYIHAKYANKPFGVYGDSKDLGIIWQIEGIEGEIDEVIDSIIEMESYSGILDHFSNSFFRSVPQEFQEKSENYLRDFVRKYSSNSDKMNVVVDIIRNSKREMFEEILLLFLSTNQDVHVFSKIWWRGNGASGTGDVILADIEAADWKDIQLIVEKSDVGVALIPIKKFIIDQIEHCLKSADWERERRWKEIR